MQATQSKQIYFTLIKTAKVLTRYNLRWLICARQNIVLKLWTFQIQNFKLENQNSEFENQNSEFWKSEFWIWNIEIKFQYMIQVCLALIGHNNHFKYAYQFFGPTPIMWIYIFQLKFSDFVEMEAQTNSLSLLFSDCFFFDGFDITLIVLLLKTPTSWPLP